MMFWLLSRGLLEKSFDTANPKQNVRVGKHGKKLIEPRTNGHFLSRRDKHTHTHARMNYTCVYPSHPAASLLDL